MIVSRNGRLLALWGLLGGLSLQDFALTMMGLEWAGGRELNPLPALAFAAGPWAALALKVVAVLFVLAALWALRGSSHERAARWIVGAWCVVLAGVNVASLVQLARAGVIG